MLSRLLLLSPICGFVGALYWYVLISQSETVPATTDRERTLTYIAERNATTQAQVFATQTAHAFILTASPDVVVITILSTQMTSTETPSAEVATFTPSPNVPPPCAYTWATQPLDDLTSELQAELDTQHRFLHNVRNSVIITL